jgi:tetratricopeptide (TPR) repeat protein
MRMRGWARLGLVAAVALAPLFHARAEKRGDALPPSVNAREAAARTRSAKASALYDAGKYDDALRLFVAAYDLAPLSDILFNIGLAREKMLDYEGCVRDFRRYLREGKDANLQSRASERLAHCAAMAQLAMRATSIPPGAAITISEPGADAHQRFLGRTPVEAKLTLGTYVVRAELPGYESAEQRLGVDVDQQRDVDFPMRKLASLSVDADSPGATARIGNDEAASLPLRRDLPAGPYKVTVTKPGHQTVTRAVTLGVGEQSTLLVALPALPQIRALTLDA